MDEAGDTSSLVTIDGVNYRAFVDVERREMCLAGRPPIALNSILYTDHLHGRIHTIEHHGKFTIVKVGSF